LDSKADIVIFVRWQDDKAYQILRNSKKRGQKVIFDLCVNYLDPVGIIGNGYGTTIRQREQAERMIGNSDGVTCASRFIKERVDKIHPMAFYIPDSINHEHFSLKKQKQDFFKKKLHLIYAGVASKAAYLFDELYPLIKRMGFGLTIISERRPQVWARYRYYRWKYERFPKDLLKGEIGIAPRRVDNPYDQGHSIFKIGVFMAEGIPVIASPVPAYSELLREDAGGAICSSLNDWESVLTQILADRDLLVQLANSGYSTIRSYYSKKIVQQYLDVFERILE
jgi:glycosyltransferase involved in cell wall biosynthesis